MSGMKRLLQSLEQPRFPEDQASLTVRYRQLKACIALEEDRAAGYRVQVNPSILEFARFIVGKRRQRAVVIRLQQQARLEQGLKAVADAEDEPLAIAELA